MLCAKFVGPHDTFPQVGEQRTYYFSHLDLRVTLKTPHSFPRPQRADAGATQQTQHRLRTALDPRMPVRLPSEWAGL